MTASITLTRDLLLGSALGALFYGGLWWTVCRVSGAHAGPWLFASFSVRTMIVLAGFCIVARSTWHDLAACIAGFLAARIIVTRYARRPTTAGRVP